MSYPEHYDWEPPDPPVDESVALRCPNAECPMFYDPEVEEHAGETWHPEIFSEWQGTRQMGGTVDFYADDSHACPECLTEGVAA